MKNSFGQETVQVQTQTQLLTPQQVMLARLTELPVDALRERIEKELEENQWLEHANARQRDKAEAPETYDSHDQHDDDAPKGQEEQYTKLQDDSARHSKTTTMREEMADRQIADDAESFYDHLVNQIGEYTLTDHQTEVLKYLIGSLDDDGLLRTPLFQIVDELDIYQGIVTSEAELMEMLHVLQQMEPAGVGGRSLQECLTLQAMRNYQGEERQLLLKLFNKCWDDLSHLRWNRIQKTLKLDDLQTEELRRRVKKLTPRPGGSIGDDRHSDNRAITPDFTVSITPEGKIHLQLNEGELPRLSVSPDAEESLQMNTVSKNEREALRYVKDRVENARYFIEAIAQRRQSMVTTMKAIIRLQLPFFLEGDETRLRPMKLEDVATASGLNISTISRVCSNKYVQTPWGTFSLKWFFNTASSLDGEEVSVRKLLDVLRQLIEEEDRRTPLSDEKLVAIMREKGFDVARRTIAKYRTQLGIPESRLRKE